MKPSDCPQRNLLLDAAAEAGIDPLRVRSLLWSVNAPCILVS